MKKNKTLLYIINLILTLLIFCIFLKIRNVYPFGIYDIANSDGIAQFRPMLFDLVMKIKKGILEVYTFNNGLGNPTIFNMLYYTSSPLNLLLIVFRDPNKMYYGSIVIKIILTSLFMTFYSSSKTENKLIIIISSLSYSFCSWFLVYYYYLSFVDIYMVFPLFQYGLEKVLKGKKSYSYIFSLFYMIMCNFYLAFSVCIYTIIYFIIYLFIYKRPKNKEKLHLFWNIAKHTIICLLLSSFWLYALIDSYKRMNLSFDPSNSGRYYVYIADFIGSLYHGFFNLTVSAGEATFPNISCPFYILLGVFYFFLSRNVDNKKKLIGLIGVLLVLLAVFFPPFDFLLNMFHAIRGLTFRYSFIICFLEIVMFIEVFNNIDLKAKETKRGLIICLILMLVLNIYTYYYCSLQLLFVIITFLIIMLILVLLYQNNKVFKCLILIIFLLQVFLSLSVSKETFYTHINLTTDYKIKSDKYREISLYDYCKEKYGVEILSLDNNCGLYDNTKSIDLMSSMTYNDVIYGLDKLGIQTYMNTLIDDETYSDLLDMLFNLNNDKYYLEKIYSVNKDILNVQLEKENAAKNQINVVKGMTGYDTVFNKEIVKAKYKYRKNFYYINHDKYIIEHADSLGNTHSYLGWNNEIYLNKNKYNKYVNIYTYNEDKIQKVYNYLSKNQIKYTYYSDSKIEGTINVDKDQIIFTTIPYDTNWNIYIDGKRIKPIKVLDFLIGIETKPGKHTIKLEYKQHFLIPFLISLFTFITFMIKSIIERKMERR